MIRTDCIYFRGDKPCQFKIVCEGCLHFKHIPKRILIIKGRAQGDVFRTTALLPGLKRNYPESHITWLVDEESTDLLRDNPIVDRVFAHKLENLLPLLTETFDILISLDKEPQSTSLATKIQSTHKYGFGMNSYGNLMVFNRGSEYAFRLGVDDDLKFFKNTKTYQEIIYEIAEIEYKKDKYVFQLQKRNTKKAEKFFQENRINTAKLSVGLNTGAGNKFQTKQWPKGHILELIHILKENVDANVFLLGGYREQELNRSLEQRSKHKVYNTGHGNSLLEFAGFLSKMDVVVSSDTLGMHIAIALGKKLVALFGPTCPQEIDLYGQGVKLFAGASCAPCFKQTCLDGQCMKDISPEQVLKEIQNLV